MRTNIEVIKKYAFRSLGLLTFFLILINFDDISIFITNFLEINKKKGII